MKCELCLQDKILCHSHIIPEFFYRSTYNDKHFMAKLTNGWSKAGYIPKGQYEKLLCADCETFLNVEYETYFDNLWYSNKTLPTTFNEKVFTVNGIDYSKFKLCLLSILWRASISSRDVFAMVKLPKKHEEQIRKMLLKKDPGEETLYQIFASLLLSPGTTKILDNLIVSPMMEEFENKQVCTFVFGGCYWLFVIDEQPLINPIAISANGNLNFPVHDILDIKPIMSFFDGVEKDSIKW